MTDERDVEGPVYKWLTITFIRHGQAVSNLGGPVPLDDEDILTLLGREQAQAIGRLFRDERDGLKEPRPTVFATVPALDTGAGDPSVAGKQPLESKVAEEQPSKTTKLEDVRESVSKSAGAPGNIRDGEPVASPTKAAEAKDKTSSEPGQDTTDELEIEPKVKMDSEPEQDRDAEKNAAGKRPLMNETSDEKPSKKIKLKSASAPEATAACKPAAVPGSVPERERVAFSVMPWMDNQYHGERYRQLKAKADKIPRNRAFRSRSTSRNGVKLPDAESGGDVERRVVSGLLILLRLYGAELPPEMEPKVDLEDAVWNTSWKLPDGVPHIVLVGHNITLCEMIEAIRCWNSERHWMTDYEFENGGWCASECHMCAWPC
ncbi:hypothetical protein CERSUDRAFT_70712 [Gelatoporia subvermispora B]|uniref:Phosphoglycerate mutase-like protein n=1 Tax=Ceriporiopsis subvermispora (strain B) TaxID=914234 RepID=M2QTC9_CERS8|nr:hypothetical protein CERSUDRAFT_70712 [Gelatoporia subvermispora B]